METNGDGKALDRAQAGLGLLHSIYKDFTHHLPTVEDAESGRFEASTTVERLRIQNEITILRSDMSFLPYKLQQVQIDRLSQEELGRFTSSLMQLLEFCERFVDCTASGIPPSVRNEQDTIFSRFPRLLAFRQSLQQIELKDDTTKLASNSNLGGLNEEIMQITIYDMTKVCSDRFEELVASLKTKSGLFSTEWSYDRFVGFRNSFAFWADSLGALGPKNTSLDDHFEDHAEVRGLVLELLEMVDRNTRHIATAYEALSGSPAESPQILQAIDSAIERLHFLARAIRRASQRRPYEEILGFRSEEHEYFRLYAVRYVESLFTSANESLCEHMGAFLAARRAALLGRQRHAKRLAEKRRDSRADDQRYGRKLQADGTSNDNEKPSQIPRLVPKSRVLARMSTPLAQVSAMKSSPFKQVYYGDPTMSTPASGFSRQDGRTTLKYPPPPHCEGEGGRVPCTFCLEPLQLAPSSTGGKRDAWIDHVNKDLQPYTCLFPHCKQLCFQHHSMWKEHMIKVHSNDWYRKVHATMWYCDLGHPHQEFSSEAAWKFHMQDSQSHGESPTELQFRVLSIQKRKRVERGEHQCPFCESVPEEIQKLHGRGNPSSVSDILMKHIGDHINFLSLIALPPIFDDEGASQRTPHKAVFQRSSERGSRKVAQRSDVDLNIQASSMIGSQESGTDSVTMHPENIRDRQLVSHITSPSLESHSNHKDLEVCGSWKVLYWLPDPITRAWSAYLDKPVWAPGLGRETFALKAFLPVTNVQDYVQESVFDFTISRIYSESSLMPELQRALTKQQQPPDPVHYHEQIQLHSEEMIEALQEFLLSQPDLLRHFSNLDPRKPIDAPYIFWYKYKSTGALQNLSHPHQDFLSTLTSWINRNYEDKYVEAKRQLDNGVVTLGTMPFLLCPGDVLVWKEKGKTKAAITSSEMVLKSQPILYWDSSQFLSMGSSTDGRTERGEFLSTWSVYVWSYSFNGDFLRDERPRTINFKASSLEQEVEISKLSVFPLRFAEEETKLQLETRGKTFWACRCRNLVSHTGKESRFVNGERFMVDFQVYKQLHTDSNSVYDEDGENRLKMSAEDMALETPPSRPYIYLFPDTIPGFHFRSKKWVDLDVDYITDVEWNRKSFDNLVIDAKAKEVIQALISHQIESAKGTDLIHRKGNGLIILLHGGPGTGKTFTAESVAEIVEKPLFCVTCGDIGTNPKEAEKFLEAVLYLGKTWGCVVLIDEAEVFLEQRSLDNLERNALVSVFLRVLEYYEGILIMTTNRVGTLDEAFKSRIQLMLHYEKLSEGQRRKIWRGFINHLEDTHMPRSGPDSGRQRTGTSSLDTASLLRHGPQPDHPDIDYQELRDYLEELAIHELNGRQIRNMITTARQVAKFRRKTLNYDLISEIISMSEKLDEYFSKITDNQSDEQIARGDGLR